MLPRRRRWGGASCVDLLFQAHARRRCRGLSRRRGGSGIGRVSIGRLAPERVTRTAGRPTSFVRKRMLPFPPAAGRRRAGSASASRPLRRWYQAGPARRAGVHGCAARRHHWSSRTFRSSILEGPMNGMRSRSRVPFSVSESLRRSLRSYGFASGPRAKLVSTAFAGPRRSSTCRETVNAALRALRTTWRTFFLTSRLRAWKRSQVPRRSPIWLATRSAFAMMVSVGFTAPMDGKKLASVT